jgi:hypothetical protein
VASANIDLVRSIYAAWERGDFNSAEWAHPEIEYVVADGPAPGSWAGLAGMAEGFRNWLSAWAEYRAEPQEYVSSTTSACSCSSTTAAAARQADWTLDR